MKFGHFDDGRREYVIETPRTPRPWINYLGSQDFFSLISNTCGGYCFYRDAALRRLTRFRYNNVPTDTGGRYFYVRDEGTVWNPGFAPTKTPLDRYECRHGLGYTVVHGERAGLSVEITFFVPIGATAEVHWVRVENRSRRRRSFDLFSFIEFALWNAQDDATNFQRNLNTGEVEVEASVIYHKTEYRERRNHFAYYSANAPLQGFDTDRESFLGPLRGFHEPQVVAEGRSRNSIAEGWSPIASHWLSVDLAPDDARDFVFVLGYAENDTASKWERPGVLNKSRAKALIERYATVDAVAAALRDLSTFWEETLQRLRTASPDGRVDRMVNIWNQYQCLTTYNIGRSASYYESGIGRGLGFRDTCQDLLGFVHMIPERARERILDVASTQKPDGGCHHQYQPLTKRGNNAIGDGFNDDPLWLVAAVAAYLKETGDWGILDERVPFDSDPNTVVPLFDHLTQSMEHVVENRGPHGLPLIGRADWNDCLNLNCYSEVPDESFQTTANREGRVAESVLIAGMFVYYGREYAEIARRRGDVRRAAWADQHIASIGDAAIRDGWDGRWYLRAYDGQGAKVGSRECDEGQIFIESQGFGAMAGIGADLGYPELALDSVKERLDTPQGIVLVQPAYTRYRLELGEISSYPPGYKENAGVFCHNNPWIMIAEAGFGRGERAFDYYRKISPAFLEESSEIHGTEPYVYSQMIAGRDSRHPGVAKNSWLTGTAAWNLVAISQHILGIKPTYDGLAIDPCIPPTWHEYTVERTFRGGRYRIRVHNPEGRSKGIRRLLCAGSPVNGTVLPVLQDGRTVDVEAWL